MPLARRASVWASAEASRGRRSGRVPSFAQRLIAWQRRHGRHDLPWQRVRDPYRIWIAEVMLQQTQVMTVLRYYAVFLDAFPDVAALARASLDAVLARWSGLGYYRRAHHLHAAARAVTEEHGGHFPGDAATLRTLPGIGRSTAAAIAAFATGERGAILDGNVKRVLARHRGVDGWPGSREVEARLWTLAESLLPRPGTAGTGRDRVPGTGRDVPIAVYTQALMDLGAGVCTRIQPRCGECPVAVDCIARRDGRADALPARRPRQVVTARAFRVLLLERDGRVALERRPSSGVWAGLWSLPELALDDDVNAYVVARFDAAPTATIALPPVEHRLTHRALTLHPLRVRLAPSFGALAGCDSRARSNVRSRSDVRTGSGGARVAAEPHAGAPEAAGLTGVSWFTPLEAWAVALPAPILRLLRSYVE